MDLRQLRNVLLPLYVATLVCAAVLGASGLADTIRLAGSEDFPITLQRAGTSVCFLALATIYAAILFRRGFAFVALPSFLVSLAAVALVFLDARGAAKGFPPSADPQRAFAASIFWWTVAVVMCAWLIRRTFVWSRKGGNDKDRSSYEVA